MRCSLSRCRDHNLFFDTGYGRLDGHAAIRNKPPDSGNAPREPG